MPTYEYECKQCGHHFEAFQKMVDAPLRECPKCRGQLKRLIGTGSGFIFKGSGFYITDYRSDSYVKGARRDADGPPAAASPTTPPAADSSKPKSGAKTEPKTEPKTASTT